MTKEYSSPKTIKAVAHKHFYIELIELTNSKYCINWEAQGQKHTSVDITDMDLARTMFDDLLVMIEGH